MAKSQTDRLTSLHETAADRQERYIDAIKSYSGITKIFTNNYLLAPILYALVLCLSLVSSVWSKAETTKFGKEAHSLADAGKEQLEEAKSTWKEEQEELKKHFEKLMQDAEDKAHAIQGSLDKKLAAQGQELKEALAKVKQLEKEKAGGNSVSEDKTDEKYQALQSELAHEKEMHKVSSDALHTAIEKLTEEKKKH